MDILKEYRADKAAAEKAIFKIIESFSDKYETHVNSLDLLFIDSAIPTGDPVIIKVTIKDNILSNIGG